MNAVRNDVMDVLKGIFRERFGIDLDSCNAKDFSAELMGEVWGLRPRHLVYLFFDLERELGITIPEKDIIEGRFDSIANIRRLLTNQSPNKEKEAEL